MKSISQIEYVKVQLAVENIEKVKKISSFAKVFNYLIKNISDDEVLKLKEILK